MSTSKYGSTDEKPRDSKIDFPLTSHTDPTNPFKEELESDFWKQVGKYFRRVNEERKKKKKNEVTWNEVETRLRVERIKNCYEGPNKENKLVLVWLITTFHDSYMEYIEKRGRESKNKEEENGLRDNFVKQLSEFAIILLEDDYYGRPKFQINKTEVLDDYDDDDDNDSDEDLKGMKRQHKRDDDDREYSGNELLCIPSDPKSKATVLHMTANRNLYEIATAFIKLYPKTVCMSDNPNRQERQMAVEYALDKSHDEVCSILMKAMLNHRVRELFGNSEPSSPARSFGNLVKNLAMKKTVLCVLDACINPTFPDIKEDDQMKADRQKRGEEEWSKQPGVPLQYNLFFQILDGDIDGRPAKNFASPGDIQGTENKACLHNTPSALQVIANHATTTRKKDEPQDPIKHIVVRHLVRRKWEQYGEKKIRIFLGMYLVFLLMLSIALFLGAMSKDPTKYPEQKDKLRGFCEVVTLLFTAFYIGAELEQAINEPEIYLHDKQNLFDVLGLVLIVAIIPCRYSDVSTVTRSVSVAAYFINFLRVFKWFPAFKELGIYAKTFAQIMYVDITKFLVVFLVVVMAFGGGVYIALITSNSLDKNFKNFLDVFIQELRALTEGKEFADSYPYHVVLTLFILLNMGAIIVVLSNILIGQLSYRYETAMIEAEMQYDIDKAKFVTSLERSWFNRLLAQLRSWLSKQPPWNDRIRHYRNAIYVSNKDMISDLLIHWNKSTDNEEEEKEAIRSMIQKRILKR